MYNVHDEVYKEALHTYDPDYYDDRPTRAEIESDRQFAVRPLRPFDVSFNLKPSYGGRVHITQMARNAEDAIRIVKANYGWSGDFADATAWEIAPDVGPADDIPF